MRKSFITTLELTIGILIVSLIYYPLYRAFSNDDGRVRSVAREMMEREAVIAGHAEWVADTNGRPQFKWKEAKP